MNPNRKKAQDFLITEMAAITPNGGNGVIYQKFFDNMTDADFFKYVEWLENGGDVGVWLSNFDRKDDVDFEDMVERCERLGRPLFQRIISYDLDTGLRTMTDAKHFVGTAELMKQSQMWTEKMHAAKDDTKTDDLTGQVMGDSRATGLSVPEVAVLGGSLGLANVTNEIYSVKGGDHAALKAYRNDLIETGKTNTNAALRKGDGVKSLRLVRLLLRGRLIDSNFGSR